MITRNVQIRCIKLIVAALAFSILPSIVFAWTMIAGFESGIAGQQAKGTDAWSDFETGSRTLFDSVANNGYTFTGNQSCRMEWYRGENGYPADTGVLYFPSSIPEGQDVWVRGYFYFPSNWLFSATGASSTRIKILRIQSNEGKIGICAVPASNTTARLMYGNDETGEADRGYSSFKFTLNKWHSLELYIHPSSSAENGIVRIWLDGILVDTISNANQTASGHVLTFAMVMSTWNSPGAPQNQYQWLDDFVATSDTPANRDAAGNPMIGPKDWENPSAPSAPSELKIVNY